MGESRETRIREFHTYNETSVLGLREGSWLEVLDTSIVLKGTKNARWFEKNTSAKELVTDSIL
jgi:dipeptidase E